MNGIPRWLKPPSYLKEIPNNISSFFREWINRGWVDLVPRCGGCLAPRMTIRLLGSFVLVSGVMVSIAEGSLLVREEQRFQRCLLQQQGLVGDRHMVQPPEKGNAQDLMECYPRNIHFIRSWSSLGVVFLVLLILATLLMFVAVATDRWRLTLPLAYGSIILVLQELILIAGCWGLMGAGDLVLYAIHIILLCYCAATIYALLRLLPAGKIDDERNTQA